MQPLVSVIIPIYNVEAYLQRCVASVRNQTYENLEIILVDDGSPDKCGSICDKLAGEDKRIVVIHKQNGGLSDARNHGLSVAKGEYIVFVDSDDYIAPFFVENLFDALVKTGSDVALCSYAVVSTDECKGFREVTEETEMEICDRNELLMNLYDANHQDATYFIVAWNKLYKRSLWEEIRFPKGKIHEDEATTYKIFDKCQKGVYVKTPMYGYFTSDSSITRGAFHINRLDWMDALNDRIRYFQDRKESKLAACTLKARADGAISYYYPLDKLTKQTGQYKKEKKMLKKYVKEALVSDREYHNLLISNKIGYTLFLLSPGIYKCINRRY